MPDGDGGKGRHHSTRPPAPDERYRLQSIDALEACYGQVSTRSQRRLRRELDAGSRRWVERSTFLVIASAGARTQGLDCSPRGDRAGSLLAVIDARRVAIPDRRGSNRLDTLRNLLVDPRIGLLCLVPGVQRALRINGRASVSVDPALLAHFTLDGVAPATVTVVDIETLYFQHAGALQRGGLWQAARCTRDR